MSLFRRLIARIGCLLAVPLLAACDIENDVSDHPSLWSKYEQGAVYRLNFDVFLMKAPQLLGAGGDVMLSPPGVVKMPAAGRVATPHTIQSYETGEHPRNERGERLAPPEWETEVRERLANDFGPVVRDVAEWGEGDVLGIVRKGTRLRATRLEMREGWDWLFGSTRTVDVIAEILDGPFAGTEASVVELSQFAPRESDNIIRYDPTCVAFCDFSSHPYKMTE